MQVQAIHHKLATVRFSAAPSPHATAATLPPPPTTTTTTGLAAATKGGGGGGALAPVKEEEEPLQPPDPDWYAELAAAVRRGKAEAVAALLEGMAGGWLGG